VEVHLHIPIRLRKSVFRHRGNVFTLACLSHRGCGPTAMKLALRQIWERARMDVDTVINSS
jgi:hypothetical protein